MSDARLGRQARMFLPVGTAAVTALLLWTTTASAMQDTSGDESAQPTQATSQEPIEVTFSFKDQTWDEILDFFSRTTGLPIVREVPVPKGTVTYIYPEPYALPEALETLNILLQTQGVMLRREEDRLFLQKLEEMQRENIPTYVGSLPENVTNDQIVTVLMPLANAEASSVAEQLANLVAGYGSVTAMPRQNALLVVETAAQIRRISMIIDEIDREDVENIVEYIPIRYATATELVKSLTSLMGERVVQYVVDAKGKKIKIEDEQVPGLQITADGRTNAIIAKGTRSKIEKLKETIALLDVPDGVRGARTMRTVLLLRSTPTAAATKLKEFYSAFPEEQRPVVIALDDVDKVSIVGDTSAVAEGVALLDALEETVPGSYEQRVTELLPLSHGAAQAAITSIKPMLGPRRERSLILVPGPDGHSIVVSGPQGGVAEVRQLLQIIDRPTRIQKQVRFLTIDSADPEKALERAQEIYQKTTDNGDPLYEVSVEFDPATRRLHLLGSAEAINRFTAVLEQAEATIDSPRSVHRLTVTNTTPSRIAPRLESLLQRMLDPRDGSTFEPPHLEPVDELDLLIVEADPAHLDSIKGLLATLDRAGPEDFGYSVIPVATSQPQNLIARASSVFARASALEAESELPEPTVNYDATTGTITVSGAARSVALFEHALGEARKLMPPDRQSRMLMLEVARASDVDGKLQSLLATAPSELGGRRLQQPTITVIDSLNALYIVADPAHMQLLERYVEELDTIEPTKLPPMKLLQVRTADATQLAQSLTHRYEQRPADQRRESPVVVDADASTNMLVVTADPTIFEEIRSFVEDVNLSGEKEPERETTIFPLKLARATDLAIALDKLYPEPPMPLDSRGRPLPHLQEPREVLVSADAATNTLIIEAPAERKQSFAALVEQLDRVELPPQAELSTFRVVRGDPEQIAATLERLAQQGVLTSPSDDGAKSAEVSIQVEPTTGTLIVTGDASTFVRVQKVLTELQSAPIPREVRVFAVERGDVSKLGEQARRLYASQHSNDPGLSGVEIEIDAPNGTIFATGDHDSLTEFTEILKKLEAASAPAPDVRLIPLTYVHAEEAVSTLNELAKGEVTLSSGNGAAPVFEAIPRTNSILVAAQPAQQEIVAALIERLDVQDSEMPPIRILQLRTAEANNLAQALNETYANRSLEELATKPVRITADVETNSLVIAAHPDIFKELEAIVTELNDVNRLDDEGREIRIFPLRVARAEELALTIDEMFPQPPMPFDSRGRPRPDLQLPREIVVRGDPQTNSIIVDAPIQRMAGFEKLVEQLDRAQIAEETEIRTWKLLESELDAVASALQRIADQGGFGGVDSVGASSITISTEPRSGTLLVSGPTEIFTKVDSVVQSFEARKPVPATSLRFFHLSSARADSIAPMLRNVLASRISEEIPGGATQLESLLEVTADRKTNTLVVQAPESVMPVAEELIKQLDTGSSAISEPVIRVRPLTFADPEQVAVSLREALPSVTSSATGEPIDVRLVASPGSNALIMVGLPPDLDEVEKLIEPLDDRPAIDAVDAQTFELTHADALEIAEVVERLLADQEQNDPRFIIERIRRSRGEVDLVPRVRVESDARTNSLIVSGPQRTVALAKTLIEQLDRPDSSGDRTYITFTPTNADPIRLAETADRVLAATRPSGARSELDLIPDSQTGVIVIVGPNVEARSAEMMLKSWDADSYSPAMDLKVINISNGDAAAIAATVGPLLADRARWPHRLRAAADAGLPVSEPRVSAEGTGNRVLVSAPTPLLPIAVELIAQLDASGSESPGEIRVYTLVQAQASDVASALQTALEARESTRPGEPKAKIVAEPSSNSIVVTATPSQQAELAELVRGFESGSGADAPAVRMVMLKFARAEVVAPIVMRLMNQDDPSLDTENFWGMREYYRELARRGVEEPPRVRVEADSRLNAVVIAAPPALVAVAQTAVEQLDVDPTPGVAGRRSVRVLAVENADAEQLGENLRALFADGEDGEQPPVIQVDLSSNALLVRATDSQFSVIQTVTQEVEKATVTTARVISTIPIDGSRANAADIARLLERILERGGEDDEVEVIPLEDLLKKYGNQTAPAPNEKSQSRSSSTPQSINGLIGVLVLGDLHQSAREAFAFKRFAPFEQDAKKPESEAADDDEADVVIAVDPETNSLLVLGSPRAVARVKALAQQAQEELPAEGTKIRSIPLPEGVSADRLRALVEQTLESMTPPGGERGALAKRIGVIADNETRSLVITASDGDFETVGALVAAYAREPASVEVTVRSYALVNVSAERAATGLEALLGRGKGATRELSITLDATKATFDSGSVRVVPDAATNSLLVLAPNDAFTFVDRFIQLMDQQPQVEHRTIRIFDVHYADATETSLTLGKIFEARARGMRGSGAKLPEPGFAADTRTNSIVVTASAEQLREIELLLGKLDKETVLDKAPLSVIELVSASPARIAEIIDKVVLGDDQALRSRTMILPDEDAGILLVRADEPVVTEIKAVLKEIDRDSTAEFPVRSIVLERADAGAVARAIQEFYEDRAEIASGARGRRLKRQVAVVGDSATSTLLVAASEADYADVLKLIERLDSVEATKGLEFRVYSLKYAKAQDAMDALRDVFEPIVERRVWGQGTDDELSGTVLARLNALLVTGNGELFGTVEQIIAAIDQPPSEGTERIVRVYPIRGADVRVVRNMIREALGITEFYWWFDGFNSAEPSVEYDRTSQMVMVAGTEDEQAAAKRVVDSITAALSKPDQEVEVIALEYAPAEEIANTLSRFLDDRADSLGEPEPAVSIAASESANTLVISATRDEMGTLKDLIAQIDLPEASGDRVIEILPLGKGEAIEIARLVSQQFPRRSGTAGVIIVADARTNALIVNAPNLEFIQVKALVEKLDGPPMREETLIRTFVLETANADEAMQVLQRTLALDAEGRTTGATVKVEGTEGDAVEVVARIVADERSNTLVVAATQESFPVIEALVSKLESAPSATSIEYRIIPLQHAEARDVTLNLDIVFRNRGGRDQSPSIDWTRDNQLVIGATSEQFLMIETILEQLDKPGELPRITDFYPLKYAEADKVQNALSYFYGPYAVDVDDPAKKNVQIAADLATNSLVISADSNEWVGIRALLEKLDSAEYDASLQLKVLPMTYADARSVARAINEAFRGPIERESRREQRRQGGDRDSRDEPAGPTILVEAEEWVSAAAEEQTNSVIVSASRKNLSKIEQIVEQIDVPDFMKMPEPRLIVVRNGSPTGIAESLRALYLVGEARGGLATRIVPDESSGTVIVRAEEREFSQIKALAEALQQEASMNGLSVHVQELKSASADRIAAVIRDAFEAQAQQANAPLSIDADLASNSIIVACTGAMWGDIRSTIEQMDKMRPAAGQGIFLIDLKHIPAEEVGRIIEEIGLEEEPAEGAVGRMIVEPVRVSVLEGRNAILVVANPADRDVIVAIAKTLDAEPELADSQVKVIALLNARADQVVTVLESLFDPEQQQVSSAIAGALQEQIRRLQIMHGGVDGTDYDVDLGKPIRLIADEQSNTVIIASSEANLRAVGELVSMLDTLPVTGEAIIRIFALENIAAEHFVRITRELYEQGRAIGETPGGLVKGVPAGAVGRALMENIALSVDERTNTVIVAGSEDAVAFVEVLVQRLDTEIGLGWVEAKILPLRFADAVELADMIDEVLVRGSSDLPSAAPLQNQAARLRVVENGSTTESEIFVPMSRLVIRADSATNSLVIVGTPTNIKVVEGLISMMDIETAFPGALVRIYPVEHASAGRIAAVLGQLFESQITAGTLREDDRVEIIPDERTNSLVVSTSTRSFAVLEQLLKTLDTRVPPDIREVKMIALENASAARIASIVQRMMDARVERLREVQPETADLEKVLVISDERTNSLVVAAGNDTFETVRRLARDLDEAPISEHGEIAVVYVPGGAIDRLSQAIDRIMERRYADIPGDVAKARRPLIVSDSRSSSLLVAADPEDLTSIRELVRQLAEVPMNPAIGLHVIPLDRGDVEQFASRLQSLMRDRSRSLGEGETPTDEVSITADPVSRTLIVAANDDNFLIVEDLVDALVRAGAETAGMQDIEIVSLMNQDAEDVVDLLDEMYIQDENRRRGEIVIRASADERLNAVIVNAPIDDREAIKRLIGRLDNTRPSHVVEIKYIPLGAANAVETVSLIENVLSGNTLAGRRGSDQATIIRYLKQIEGESPPEADGLQEEAIQTEVSSAIRESISLTPDVRTNTVIVRAPRDAMVLLEKMIRDLDSSTTGNQDIRVFKLANADAGAMADILGDLFNLRQQGSLYVLKPREVTTVVDETGISEAGPGALGTDLTLVPDQRQALSITVDSRTNSLLVSGTPTYLELVTDVVAKLDAEEANERETWVYPLRNAQASEIARVIGEFVSEDQRKLIETLGSEQLPSASRLLEREVTIVSEDKSNSVLVNASPRYREKVMEMIKQLDVDPPQVLIQVLLAEITLDDEDQWGLTVNDKVGVLPLKAQFGFVGGMLGGGVEGAFEINSGDLSLTLAAMESQQRLNLLANPSITVANNEEGRIQVGETLRLPNAVATFDTGIQNATVVPEETGTILNVLPTINPDGYVRMVINPEISILSGNYLQLSTDFQSPIIIRRTATTTVTVRDGETVVIGGLIRTKLDRKDQKIPLLGDIPLIGALFRSEEETINRTELLIVLTPHVITSPTAANWKQITDDTIDQMPIDAALKEEIRRGQLEGSTEKFNPDFESKGLRRFEN